MTESSQEQLNEMEDFSTKIGVLVRLGLMPINDLPFLKRALTHMSSNMYLPLLERKVFYKFVNDLLKITLDNPGILRLIMNKTGSLKRDPAFSEEVKRTKRKFQKRTENTYSSEGDIVRSPATASEEIVAEHVVKRGKKFVVTNKAGTKTLGTHGSRKSAVKQLQAIEISKHAHGESMSERETIVKTMLGEAYSPKTGASCSCKKGQERDNCPRCEGSGQVIDFAKIHAAKTKKESVELDELSNKTLRSYWQKSTEHVSKFIHNAGGKGPFMDSKKVNKRAKGRLTAASKLHSRQQQLPTKEEVTYTERFNNALEKFGVKDLSELDAETTKDFLVYVDTQNEAVISANSQKKLPMTDAMKSQVASDMAKRKADKDRLMAAAKTSYHSELEKSKSKEMSPARKLFKQDVSKDKGE